jgi:hypothetical protein
MRGLLDAPLPRIARHTRFPTVVISVITSAIKPFRGYLRFPSLSLDFLRGNGNASNKDGLVRGFCIEINAFGSIGRKRPRKVS